LIHHTVFIKKTSIGRGETYWLRTWSGSYDREAVDRAVKDFTLSELEDRAVARYRDRREESERAELEMLRTRRQVCTNEAARVLEVHSSCLNLDMQYGRKANPTTWIFRHQGMDFWVKWIGGHDPCHLYVKNVWGEGHSIRNLTQLGKAIHDGIVRVNS
jgi:hypothetical protein